MEYFCFMTFIALCAKIRFIPNKVAMRRTVAGNEINNHLGIDVRNKTEAPVDNAPTIDRHTTKKYNL